MFSIKQCFLKLTSLINIEQLDLCTKIWSSKCPPKVQVFIWLAAQNRIACKDLLAKRRVIVPGNDFSCPWCSLVIESSCHLHLHCNFAWSIRSVIMDWWGLLWCPPLSVSDLIVHRDCLNALKIDENLWSVILADIFVVHLVCQK